MIKDKDLKEMVSIIVPAKHNLTTEETQDCVHPESVTGGCGH